jgi:hypothetical protein
MKQDREVKPNQDEERTFKATFGTHFQQPAGTWKDQRNLTWRQLTKLLTDHKEGSKDGPCIVPATLRKPERKQEYADEIGLLALDSDCGHTLDEIVTRVKQHGYAAIIHSTHSHLSTTTTIGRSEFDRFNGTAEQYLLQRKHYLPRVAAGAKIIIEDEQDVTIEHEPCSKYRVFMWLDWRWQASRYQSQEEANKAWRQQYKAAAHHLDLTIDSSGADPNRLFFLPRHRPGAPFESLVIEGSHVPIWDLPAAPEDAPPKAQDPPKQQSTHDDQVDVIGPFNQKYSIESILERNEYKKHGHKYLAPTSSSKEPGVSIKDGRAFSHHESDPLYGGDAKHSHDAFSAYCTLEHSGNTKEAIKAAAKDLGIDSKKGQSGPSASAEAPHQAAETTDWEPEVIEWPVLSADALKGLAGQFVDLATRDSEADRAAVLATFLCRFGIEAGTRPYMWVGDSKHYPRLFVAVVGNTSKSRKGTSRGPVDRFFLMPDTEGYFPCQCSPGPLSSGEGLVFAVRDPIYKPVFDKRTGTTETHRVDDGVTDKRLWIIDEEFSGALAATKREGNTLSTILRCAWDNGSLEPLTKQNKISATGAHIGVTTHITIHELRRKLEEVEAFNGFSNRFLWVCARRTKLVPLPEPMPDRSLSALQQLLIATLREAQQIGRMGFSDAAEDLWRTVYPEIAADHDGLAGAVINRGEAQVVRLGMTYALLDGISTIHENHLRSALAMWDYCRASALYIFHGFEDDPVSTKIMEKLSEGPIEFTDLYRIFSNNASKRQIEEAVSGLAAKSKVTIEMEPTGKRPKRTLRLHSITNYTN